MTRLPLAAVIAATLVAAPVLAGETAPENVKFEDGVVTASLTGAPGDPVAGREVFMNRKLGNCLACHTNADMADQGFHGEVGPPLDGVGSRWEEAELRGIVANSKQMFDGTIMPGFYVVAGLNRPLEGFEDQPILTAQQVEDLVAYLLTLTE